MRQIKPQKARGKLTEEMWTSLDWIAEEKYDGDRRIAQFLNGVVRFTGCRESADGSGFVEKSLQIPHISAVHRGMTGWFKLLNTLALSGTVLDGEVVPPFAKEIKGGRSKYVTSIMGSSPEEAIRKQKERGFLNYIVFDCLWFKGQDVRGYPLRERYNLRDQALKEWGNSYVTSPPQIVGGSKRPYLDLVVGRGGEGVVLKHYDHRYGDEKLWVKVKAEATADVVILGFTEGRGKYVNQIGAIIFGQYQGKKLVVLGQCSGMDDTLRADLTRFHGYIGKVIEIMHNGREPTGAFRHPRFKKFRPDKNPKDCVYNPEET
jgi:ATP-dependent DNA ligase